MPSLKLTLELILSSYDQLTGVDTNLNFYNNNAYCYNHNIDSSNLDMYQRRH